MAGGQLVKPRVVLVEDDARLGAQLASRLNGAGYDAVWLRDGRQATLLAARGAGLVILDLVLPGLHGLDVLKRLREESEVPILAMSDRNETQEKVRALALGADDYVTKPCSPEELLARVAARLRRPALQRPGGLELGGLRIQLEQRRVAASGEAVELTRVEFDLLAALARRAGTAVSRDWLAENVLDPQREGGERTLDVHVCRLRKKLGVCGRQLATVWGVGYRLEPS
jgi:two-component system response regulator MtrA